MLEHRYRMRRAEVFSISGAIVSAAGLGLLLGRWLMHLAIPLILVGAVVHLWGMYTRHRLDPHRHSRRATREKVAYGLYWIVIAAFAVHAILVP